MAQQETLGRRVPAYRQTQDSGLPTLPNRPRSPHFPHARLIVAGAVLALATVGIANRGSQTNSETQPDARTNLVPAELMRYPYDSRTQPINLSIDFSGELIKEWTSTPQVLTAKSDDGTLSYYVSFLGDSYDNPFNPDDPFGHVKITMLNDVMDGGIWLEETDVNGNSLVDSNGLVTLWKPYHVENLQIPIEVPEPISA